MLENRTEIKIGSELEKYEVVEMVDEWRKKLGLTVEEVNVEKPWGAYWRIADEQIEEFVEIFFSDIKEDLLHKEKNLSPKFLLVAPGHRLSWQFHNRRIEEWLVVVGPVGIKASETDSEPSEMSIHDSGERISLDLGRRHRLIGNEGWGLVAEIWVHADKNNPSDEEDIVRVQDDYLRYK